MNKAECRAIEKYPIEMYEEVGWSCVDKNSDKRKYFIEGYHKAEEDLELSWEDMLRIDEITSQVFKDSDTCQTEVIYQEVLKRFKDLKMK